MTRLESFTFSLVGAALLIGGMALVSWNHWQSGLFFMFCSAVVVTGAQILWNRTRNERE